MNDFDKLVQFIAFALIVLSVTIFIIVLYIVIWTVPIDITAKLMLSCVLTFLVGCLLFDTN